MTMTTTPEQMDAQIGLIDATGLPISGAESAQQLLKFTKLG